VEQLSRLVSLRSPLRCCYSLFDPRAGSIGPTGSPIPWSRGDFFAPSMGASVVGPGVCCVSTAIVFCCECGGFGLRVCSGGDGCDEQCCRAGGLGPFADSLMGPALTCCDQPCCACEAWRQAVAIFQGGGRAVPAPSRHPLGAARTTPRWWRQRACTCAPRSPIGALPNCPPAALPLNGYRRAGCPLATRPNRLRRANGQDAMRASTPGDPYGQAKLDGLEISEGR